MALLLHCCYTGTDTPLPVPTFPPSSLCALQHFSHPGAVDILRAVRLGAYGFLIDGPVGSMWYDVLEKCVYPTEGTSTKAVLAKTALDQVVYATIMTGGCLLQPASPAASISCSQHILRPASSAASMGPASTAGVA